MRLEELKVDIADLSQISSEQFTERSSGLHVSAIINYIMEKTGMRDNTFTRVDLDLFAIIGRLWEQMLANILFKPPQFVRPGEIECDGIIGSPDAIDCHDPAVVEFKVTWKSSNKKLDSDFVNWLWQTKAYCHMLGLAKVRLYVFFVCGDWRPPIPKYKAWELTFSEHEIKDNWRNLVASSKEMR